MNKEYLIDLLTNNKVVGIYRSPSAGFPMEKIDTTYLNQRGIDGDRYQRDELTNKAKGIFSGTRIPDEDRDLSIIFLIGVYLGNMYLILHGARPLTLAQLRRNICVTASPYKLNESINKEFSIGKAELIGTEPCRPCTRPPKLLNRMKREEKLFAIAFEQFGGIRAHVIKPAEINMNSKIAF